MNKPLLAAVLIGCTLLSQAQTVAIGGNDRKNQVVLDVNGSPSIAITEINYNSDPYNESNDWVELHNYGGSAVDISNWKLKDETPFNSFTIPSGTVLDANE